MRTRTAPFAMLLLLASPATHAMRPVTIDSGGDTSCGIVDNGHIACWGGNRHGIVTRVYGTYADSPRIIRTSDARTLRAMTQVSVSPGNPAQNGVDQGGHACAIDSGRQAWCWGRADKGRLGTIDPGPSSGYPARVHFDDGSPMPGALSISAGGAHTCAALYTGRVHCWGVNRLPNGIEGLLAQDETQAAAHQDHPRAGFPVRTATGVLEGVVAVAAGRAHACALTLDGSVYCYRVPIRGVTVVIAPTWASASVNWPRLAS
ncbi:RCC1 domain-containing protein [Pseudofulvimonas gallinarii]|uniref:Regulator of Chromosome Condensation (RCC1) repeat protein n=2 Tax=Pseudofulvimonas gallinarii TaxID=634155 RepID=A0A4R3L138_9GAMM|nr:hypothetical protein [Pseudofulvimonas gallinarii]TCS93059.1 Regulator of Chromosome Condensation (RCC1) repeat protein [Pseudofulvimonas gallinarii]THD12226.1 hypothetical protein B1808_13725 [Pseudofulvimonas gallinarii]